MEILSLIYKNNKFLSFQYFILYYLFFRFIFDVSYPLIYTFIIIMLALRIGFEKIAFVFFSVAMVIYLLGMSVEANHYFSFFYGFIFLSFLKYIYLFIKDRNGK